MKGEVPDETGFTEPAPFSVIVTVVAFVKVFPLIVTGVVPHVLPLKLLIVSDGPFVQPHETGKVLPVVVQPEEFLTVMEWVPFAIPVNVRVVWNAPPSRLYSSPASIGPVIVIVAFPGPAAQSIVCAGAAGLPGAVVITTSADGAEVQPAASLTV